MRYFKFPIRVITAGIEVCKPDVSQDNADRWSFILNERSADPIVSSMTCSLELIYQIRSDWQNCFLTGGHIEPLLHIVSAGTLPLYSVSPRNLKVLASCSRYMVSSADINLGPRAAEYAYAAPSSECPHSFIRSFILGISAQFSISRLQVSPPQVNLGLNSTSFPHAGLEVILYYDYMLTFSREVQFLWPPHNKQGWFTIGCLLNRYLPLLGHLPYVIIFFVPENVSVCLLS
jgi:Family of unknown function (DUF6533)